MGETSRKKHSRGPTIWKVTRKSAMKDIANCPTKRLRLDSHNFKKEELETVGIVQHGIASCLEMLVFGQNW